MSDSMRDEVSGGMVRGGGFETLPHEGIMEKEKEKRERTGGGPAKSIEGWVIIAIGIHEEAQEDDIYDVFADFGDIRNLHLNLDRRSGYAKGYCLVEFASSKEAKNAIKGVHGQKILGMPVSVDWAFIRAPEH